MEPLGEDELEVYSRQIALQEIGLEGQTRLRNSRVLLVGLGGLGNINAMKLAGLGVGYLRIVDRDVVSRSDLHRQYLYTSDDVGLPKVEAAAKRLSRINPKVEVDPLAMALTSHTAKEIVGGVDLVVDGLDGAAPRYILNRACISFGIPYVFGAAIELKGNASTIIPGKTPCFECFYGGLKDEDVGKCAVIGVHQSSLGIISSLQIFDAVRLVTGREPHLAGRLIYINLATPSFDLIDIRRRGECRACGKGRYTPVASRDELHLEEVCGRDGRGAYTVTPREPLDLDIKALARRLRRAGTKILKEGELGLTLQPNTRTRFSILKSGVGIALLLPPRKEGDAQEALRLYRDILISHPP